MSEYPIVFILGMHRSGTSCLAGCLEACGLYLGKVDRFRKENRRGNLELLEMNAVQDDVFRANGGSWAEPPDRITVTSDQQLAMKKILAGFPRDVICGLKDPRMLLLMDEWMQAAGPCVLVGTYRHPIAVAESLAKRSQISTDQAYRLWLRYNAELVRLHQKHHFPIIKFDLSDVDAYATAVAGVALKVGLVPDVPQIRGYVDTHLDHNDPLLSEVPRACQEAYDYLERHRYQPNHAEGLALENLQRNTTGSQIKKELAASTRGLLKTLESLRVYAGELEKSNLERGEWGLRLDETVRQQEGRLGEHEKVIHSQQQTTQDQQQTIQSQQDAARQYQNQVRQLEQELLAKSEVLARQFQELAVRSQRVHDQDGRINEQARTIAQQGQELRDRQFRLQEHERRAAEQADTIERQRAALAARQQQIEQQNQTLAEQVRAAQRQAAERSLLQQTLTEQAAQLTEQHQQVAALTTALQDRDAAITQLEERMLREQERAIRDRESKLEELRQLTKTQADKIAWQDETLKAKRAQWERLYNHRLLRLYRWLKRGGRAEPQSPSR